MSNKMTCPACDAHLSSVWTAFHDGDPCPNCGLPAESAWQFIAARERGANEGMVEAAAKAEARAARAEAEVKRLREKLQSIRWDIDEAIGEDAGGSDGTS